MAFLFAYVIVLKAFLEGCMSSLLPVKSVSSIGALLDNPAFRFGVIEGGASHEFLQVASAHFVFRPMRAKTHDDLCNAEIGK